MFAIWVSGHRNLILGLICLVLWCTANFIYLRTDIARRRAQNRAHSWSVDMSTKTGEGGRIKRKD